MGLTQARLGTRLHVRKQTIINWEKGRAIPPATRLPAILDLLGTPPPPELIEVVSESGSLYGGDEGAPGRITCQIGSVVIEIVGRFRWTIRDTEG